MSEDEYYYKKAYDADVFYILVSNHIINLSGLTRASKYSFSEDKESKKWWIQLVYHGSPELNITLENEKEWLDAFDCISRSLGCY